MQLHRCFKCFVVRNHVNRQIKTSREGSRICRLKSMVLRRFLNTIQSEENLFQDGIIGEKGYKKKTA